MAILLAARATGYGKLYPAELSCEECGASIQHDFDLTKVSFTEPENKVEYDPDTNTYKVLLPVTKLEASVKLLTDRELTSLEKEKNKKKEFNIPFNSTISRLNKMLVSVNGTTQREALEKLVDVLPAADAKKILNFNINIFPKISTKQEVVCNSCGAQSEREVPLTWAFFRIDL